MPYINTFHRSILDLEIEELASKLDSLGNEAGNLNYAITKLLHAAWNKRPSYKTGNELVGVLECAKQEFYRRILSPYEDKKIEENGDV